MERKDVVRTQNFIQTPEFIYVKAGEFSPDQLPVDRFLPAARYTSYFALQQVLNELLEAV